MNTPSGNKKVVISQVLIAYFSQNPLSPKKNDDGQKNTEKEEKQTLKGIPFEVCFFSKNGQKPCKINAFEKCFLRIPSTDFRSQVSQKGVAEEARRR